MERFDRLARSAQAAMRTCVDENAKALLVTEQEDYVWGIATPQSKDVIRMVYARPQADYLSLDPSKSETPELVDPKRLVHVIAWDVRQFIAMIRDSRAAVFEMLGDRAPCLADKAACDTLFQFAEVCLDPTALRDEYADDADATLAKYRGNNDASDLLSATRLAACADYVSRRHLPPPTNVNALMRDQPAEVASAVDMVIRKRRFSSNNIAVSPDDARVLLEWIDAAVSEARKTRLPSREKQPWALADKTFVKLLWAER